MLKELHAYIAEATAPILQKQALMYYLLKDCVNTGTSHGQGGTMDDEVLEQYVQGTGLPRQYWLFMAGIWNLDRMRYAVSTAQHSTAQHSTIQHSTIHSNITITTTPLLLQCM